MRDKLEDTRINKVETGFSLCRRKDNNIIRFGNECEGTECRIRRPSQRCKGDDIYEGLYHTHPHEKARPSTADLHNIYKDGLGCIGSVIDNDIRCLIRKSPEMSIKVLGTLAFEHLWAKFRAKETDEEFDIKIKNLADKYFREVVIKERTHFSVWSVPVF